MNKREQKFGQELAQHIAHLLQQSDGIYYIHRDYCGMGLHFDHGHFHYGETWDGYPGSDQQWSTAEAFVQWLAEQSDASLDRSEHEHSFYHHNQTITRERLEAALAHFRKGR